MRKKPWRNCSLGARRISMTHGDATRTSRQTATGSRRDVGDGIPTRYTTGKKKGEARSLTRELTVKTIPESTHAPRTAIGSPPRTAQSDEAYHFPDDKHSSVLHTIRTSTTSSFPSTTKPSKMEGTGKHGTHLENYERETKFIPVKKVAKRAKNVFDGYL